MSNINRIEIKWLSIQNRKQDKSNIFLEAEIVAYFLTDAVLSTPFLYSPLRVTQERLFIRLVWCVQQKGRPCLSYCLMVYRHSLLLINFHRYVTRICNQFLAFLDIIGICMQNEYNSGPCKSQIRSKMEYYCSIWWTGAQSTFSCLDGGQKPISKSSGMYFSLHSGLFLIEERLLVFLYSKTHPATTTVHDSHFFPCAPKTTRRFYDQPFFSWTSRL